MKKVKLNNFLIFVFLILADSALASQINSTYFKQTVIISSGGENASGTSFKMGIATGIISLVINSTSFINKLGFFHLLMLADNQPCTSASQCEGGFCCSNLCTSSSCPSGEAGPSGGGGGGGVAAGGGGGSLPNITKEITSEVPKVMDFSVSASSLKEHLALGNAKTIPVKMLAPHGGVSERTANFYLRSM